MQSFYIFKIRLKLKGINIYVNNYFCPFENHNLHISQELFFAFFTLIYISRISNFANEKSTLEQHESDMI